MRYRSLLTCDQLDDGSMSRGSCQCAVAGDKWCVKSFRQGEVRGVVSRDVMAQFPDTTEKWPVGVAFERHLKKRQKRLPGPLR